MSRTYSQGQDRTKDWTLKAKASTKDFFRVLKESLRPGPRPRTDITGFRLYVILMVLINNKDINII